MRLSRRSARVLATAGTLILLLSGCARMLDGTPVSIFADPFRVGGLQAVDGPTGLRPDAPPPDREVKGTDGGRIDQLAAQSVSDLEAFWTTTYPNTFDGDFKPASSLLSWDPGQRKGTFCRNRTFLLINAAYCYLDNTIGWDRRLLLPALRNAYGDMAITMVLAHEYGHAIARTAGITKRRQTPTLVAEQQADCLAGVYLRWVAHGDSPRFTLSTGDGLNGVLAAMLALRDPLLNPGETVGNNEHGSAFERISAFQFGFTEGADSCRSIDAKEIEQRRGELPIQLQQNETGEVPVSEDSVRVVVEAMNILFTPAKPPQLSFDAATASCTDARPSRPASYCPATNTITVDLPGLQTMGTPSKDAKLATLSGDNTAYSVLVSRYMQAVQIEHGGLVLDNAAAALRTACLTGVATTKLSQGVTTSNGGTIALTAGDLDEAVAGLLTNGLAAGDINGESVPAGFSRIDAYRTGVLGDFDRCLQRFP
ncbi:neutral zinc metallopeptidase [[Mycobacterium] crassicus]|uniref:Neutral zinc metallopeptidase n=1 Tax=[Mycobacterium] crassicus TaxID=2872309 RepID=A0ABU5XNR9_9MYCO|nr:neutral zinc metallopeptidase [Mycolicibacter sp. MYC098]MEB3023851.1 neutral zinc metallopeptidase [Mycolicibacter sp. MYC098]